MKQVKSLTAEQLEDLKASGAKLEPKKVLPRKEAVFPAPAPAPVEVPHASMRGSMAAADRDLDALKVFLDRHESAMAEMGEQIKEAIQNKKPVPWVLDLERSGKTNLLTRVRMNPVLE
jgi:hypothetical protein